MSCRDREAQLVDHARGVLAAALREEIDAHAAECAECAARLRREQAVSAVLRSLSDVTAAPAADVMERRLLEEFARVDAERRAAHSPTLGPPVAATRASHLPRSWLAFAALIALLVGGAAAWRGLTPAVRDDSRELPRLTARGEAASRLALEAPKAMAKTAAAAAGGLAEAKTGPAERAGDRTGRRPVRPAHGRVVVQTPGVEFVAWPGAHALPPFESGSLVRTELPAPVLSVLGLADQSRAARGVVAADVIVGQDGMPRAVRVVR